MLADRDYIKTKKKGKEFKKQPYNQFIFSFINWFKKLFFKKKFTYSEINNSDLNQLLKKISKQGIKSLTYQEKKQLNIISNNLK